MTDTREEMREVLKTVRSLKIKSQRNQFGKREQVQLLSVLELLVKKVYAPEILGEEAEIRHDQMITALDKDDFWL